MNEAQFCEQFLPSLCAQHAFDLLCRPGSPSYDPSRSAAEGIKGSLP